MNAAKPFTIPKQLVYDAWKAVKANAGSAGVDKETIEDFEADLKNNLYRIWNRMSSGSYFPPPVKAVAIPKKNGGERILGVPTVADRVAQMVVKRMLEPAVEPIFLPDSYGYRPGKSALDAVAVTRKRCWQFDWVLEFDIKGLFDNIDHALLRRALEKHTACEWVRLYIRRWLTAPLQLADGTLVERTKGTPQGGVVSPVLANLFLHYTFRPRVVKNRKRNSLFVSFTPAVSGKALKAMRETTRQLNYRNRTELSLRDISRLHNPVLRGWVAYYGRFYPSAMYPVFRHFNKTLVAWAMRKYRRLKRHKTRASLFLEAVAETQPHLFVHWQKGMVGAFA